MTPSHVTVYGYPAPGCGLPYVESPISNHRIIILVSLPAWPLP